MERAGRRDEVKEDVERRVRPGPSAVSAPAAQRVLALQRSAGNAAVARFIVPLGVGLQPVRGTELPGIVVCLGGTTDPIIDTEHHWIEIGEESYGWWPSRLRGDADVARIGFGLGVPGILNGTTLGIGGTPTRDPRHGRPARRFAVVADEGTGAAADLARTAAADIRSFALGYEASYSWNPFGTDCQEFVEDALDAASVRRGRSLSGGGPLGLEPMIA